MDSTTAEDFIVTEANVTVFTKPCILYFFIVGTLLGGFLIIIGLLGNFLSLIILRKERKKSSTIQALCLLAVADTGLLLSYFPFPMMEATWARKTYLVGMIAGVYTFEAARICNQVSALLTMILMWQRYVAVCLPHKAKQLCTVRIVNQIAACSGVAALAFYLPNLFLYSIKTSDDGGYYPVSHPLVKNAYFQMIYSVILTYLVSYIIPVVSLLYMSVAILRSFKSHSNTIASSVSSQHARKDLTKSSIAIVVIYVICQSFQPIRRILMWVYDPYMVSIDCGGELFHFSYVPHLALMLNSSANFGIYILFTRGFRRKLFTFLIRKNAVGPTDYNDIGTKPGTSIANTSAMAPVGVGSTDAAKEKIKCSETKAPSDGTHAISLSEPCNIKANNVGHIPIDTSQLALLSNASADDIDMRDKNTR
ncbi:hypothetical protein CAPTEDRAFT_202118 [Capitella teleta]|uniref:G-protein coupled receptors family 1 profile domain-containing protein n=1 Tax=Capitella teleta TaxID=283909 RepID=R7U2Z3_CAPTE|nr:hypothetical protein CAPTEDRAFT_202118 [Capitella teleta]|eukprot:ELU00720.1 hypothetical protein CAPTEDRAFT_202118 [Capitella teleta]